MAGTTDTGRQRFLTVGWNNVLVAVLGIPMLAYSAVALSTDTISNKAALIGLFLVGAFY